MPVALLCGLPTAMASAELPGNADVQAQLDQLKARVEAQDKEIAQLRQADDDQWLTETRATQIRGLVQDVLADADTRSSLLQSGMTGGWDKGFFLASPDGNYRLNVKGLLQVRHIFNSRDNDSTVDGTVAGFQVMRANMFFSGHVINPKIVYELDVAGNRNDGEWNVEWASIGYKVDDHLTVNVGRFRNYAFLREERLSYAKQLQVERSYLNEEFTMDYAEGVNAVWQNDNVRLQGVFSDGSYSGTGGARDFNAEDSDFAFTGRLDWKIAGDWAQMDDFSAVGNGDKVSSVIGAAAHYEIDETGTTSPENDFFTWTVDGSLEMGGFNIYGAFVGRHTDADAGEDRDQYGFIVQGGYVFNDEFEPFVAFQWMDFDGATVQTATAISEDELSILTGGLNWYIHGHAAKFTMDLSYAFDGIPANRTNTGFLADGGDDDGQIVVRSQLQLMF